MILNANSSCEQKKLPLAIQYTGRYSVHVKQITEKFSLLKLSMIFDDATLLVYVKIKKFNFYVYRKYTIPIWLLFNSVSVSQ